MQKSSIKIKCLRCQKERMVWPSILKKGGGKYCSSACSSLRNWSSEEYREHQKKIHKGYVPSNIDKLVAYTKSEEGRNKNSKRQIGKIPWNKGIYGLQTGENSPHWKGGITKIDKLCRRMPEYKQWRSDVFQRDSWTCQTCQAKGYITAHHIKSFSKIIKENMIKNILDARKCIEMWNVSNGVTLCEPCHSMTDNYKGRNKNKNI